MTTDELKRAKKSITLKKKPKSHSYVKDADLQIHISMIKDANVTHRVPHFKFFHSPSIRWSDLPLMEISESLLSQSDSLKIAMDDARSSFDSIMLIREQLNLAYQELMQKQR